MTPYEQYKWICQSFPYPRPGEERSFEDLVCNLARAYVRTTLWYTKNRIFVFTWLNPSENA
ncbi:MAG: hypothetical protein WAN72_18705 [Candidatus Acidiferrales bacterium]